jgi:hypothetical protein
MDKMGHPARYKLTKPTLHCSLLINQAYAKGFVPNAVYQNANQNENQ